MSGPLKSVNLGQLAICPQYQETLPNWYFQLSGGTNSPPTATIDVLATPADPLAQNTNMPDSTAADGFLQGLFAYFATGANAGEWRQVTGYSRTAPGVATFTFGPGEPGGLTDLPATPLAGDTMYVFAPLPADSISDGGEPEKLPREYETLTYDGAGHVVGLKTNQVSFGIEAAGLETPRSSLVGSTSNDPDRWGHLLEGLGTRIEGAGTTVHATEPSTNSRLYVTSNSGFTPSRIPAAGTSNHLMVAGQMRRVTAVGLGGTGGVIPYVEVAPDLITVPAAGSSTEVYACETYVPAEDGQKKFTVLRRRDDQLREYRGCVLTLSGTMSYGALIKFTVDLVGDDYVVHDNLPWNGVQSSQSPVVANVGSGFFLEPRGPVATDAALPLTEFNFDFAVERSLQKLSTGHRQKVTGRPGTSVSAKVANADKELKTGTTYSELGGEKGYLLGQGGVAAGAAIGFSAYAQIESCVEAEQDGVSYWDLSLKHTDGDLQSTPNKPLLMRF